MIKVTSSLKKIYSLKKRIKVIQGGQGASKSYSILIILIDYCLRNPNVKVTVFRHELTKAKKTIVTDFLDILRLTNRFNQQSWKHNSVYYFNNNSFIEFVGLDRTTIGKGFRRDIVYINECNEGVSLDTYINIASRSGSVYLDYNPDDYFWVHSDVLGGANVDFLNLTYLDNECISSSEVETILEYKVRGFINPELDGNELFKPENIKSEYWANKWRVNGLGQIGIRDGIVFDDWTQTNYFPPPPYYYGVDFGYTNDPTAIVEIAFENENLYVRELFYKTGFTSLQIGKVLVNLGIDYTRPIVTDIDHNFIRALRNTDGSLNEVMPRGFNVYGADKRSIMANIDNLKKYNVFIHFNSLNLWNERNKYSYAKDPRTNTYINKPIDKYDHAINALMYVAKAKGVYY